jgi:hypothetical protein
LWHRAALLAVLAVLTSSLVAGCVPAPGFVVGMTTDADGRIAVIVQRCDDHTTSATIWLRDGSGPPFPHTSAGIGPASTSPPTDLISILSGPLGPEPVVVPIVEPSAAGWTAQPAIAELAPHRQYTMSRERMTNLRFEVDRFGQPPLDAPGSIVVDSGHTKVLDLAAWREYVADLCG